MPLTKRHDEVDSSSSDSDDDVCFRCGRQGHWAEECYAGTHINGLPLLKSSPGVYALLYANGNVYVGKAKVDVTQRVLQHRQRSTNAPKCTVGWGTVVQELPLLTTGDVNDLESWERAETLARMKVMSVDRVRGWRYVASILPPDLIADANAQLRERFDACRSCEPDRCSTEHRADLEARDISLATALVCNGWSKDDRLEDHKKKIDDTNCVYEKD